MSSTGTTLSASEGDKGFRNGAAPAKSKSHSTIALLRLLAFAATLSAFVTMITNKQKITIGPFTRWSKWHYSDAFMWFVVANCIAFIYLLFAAILGLISHSPMLVKHLVILDLIVSYMLFSAASAATAVAYIGKNGISQPGWTAICGVFERYCHHVAGALVACFLGWLFLTIAVFLGMRRSPAAV
ncbi:hypothetical protein MPTK1_3g16500 [Marchantia polymorpha subsp. ruderalis]|uniref:CASP-like protein 1U1 n=3 Tax=Marchantia polymorpha TaxID=3197 RepID=CSPL2_MARPO|nr:RecName: Full=CASP-like protein 1U1; Short=MpCASPL1U1 [Marchantia polymorpha]OAE22179.1 hypothetical protein AXG93_3271s1220 [Marchantia polymorpha subsp. ruderalis]PTQ48722.1 hypothetical protein MARPO_0004s0021 [Marchantia polymorpha]BBN05855.1 hypothetical protein Mp_3g16500 [Marchantia polymorpha subsp. ruderalis]|eukprot:PTQ48722.1 hypothetical protein MARPO_0004s0021 [Marchantia polymorpha]